MIQFVFKRLSSIIPSLFGISLITFAVLNLSMGYSSHSGASKEANRSVSYDDRSRYPDQHLPLFINLSIDDAQVHAMREMVNLGSETTAQQAKRAISAAGGAWLPYLLPSLTKLSSDDQAHLLEALQPIGQRIGILNHTLEGAKGVAFWERYWRIYRSDFKPVRAARLVRRVVRHNDLLARQELLKLDTFALPQLIEVLDPSMSETALIRVLELLVAVTGINDVIEFGSSIESREKVIARWQAWWTQRYDRFTVFDRFSQITGAITETRYYRWMKRLVTLDFGVSTRDGRPILEKLWERLPVTMLLSGLGLIFAFVIAIPIGIISAVRRGRLFDRLMMLFVFVLYSFPTFWLAMWLIRFFAGNDALGLFPAQGLYSTMSEGWTLWEQIKDAAHHLVLPVVCLSSVSIAVLARYQRVGMIQVIDKDYIRAARARGLSWSHAIMKHGLRNGIVPVVTMLGLQIPYLISGSVVVERIFGIPGIGYETFDAILAQDQPWLLAVVTVTALMTMLGIIIADTIYAILDPRMMPGAVGENRS